MNKRRCRSFERVVEDMIEDRFGEVEPLERYGWATSRRTEIELTRSSVRTKRWRAWVVVSSTPVVIQVNESTTISDAWRDQVTPRFTTCNHPVDLFQIHGGRKRADQGLGADEPDAGIDLDEGTDSLFEEAAGFDRGASPEVVWEAAATRVAQHLVGALRQDLVLMLRGIFDDVEDLVSVVVGNCIPEQVRHRVGEDHRWLLQASRFIELMWADGEVEAVRECVGATESLGQSHGIAILAALAELFAPTHRVPRDLGPFDCGSVHWLPPVGWCPTMIVSQGDVIQGKK